MKLGLFSIGFVLAMVILSVTTQALEVNQINETTAINLTMNTTNQSLSLNIRIPIIANVTSAKVNITGFSKFNSTNTYPVYNDFFNFSTATQDTEIGGIYYNGTDIWITGTTTYKVYRYMENGTYTGINFSVASETTSPRGITYSNNSFWVVGQIEKFVFRYYNNGTYTGESINISSVGVSPVGLTSNESNFWVTKVGTGTDYVSKYDFNGTLIYSFSVGAGTTDASGLGFDGEYIWVSDSDTDEVRRYKEDGNLTAISISFTGIDTDIIGISIINGTYYIPGNQNSVVFRFKNWLFPSQILIDSGIDGIIDDSFLPILNNTNSPQEIDLNITRINDFLSTCIDDNNFCNYPLNVSATVGIVKLNNLNITYSFLPTIVNLCNESSNTTSLRLKGFLEELPLQPIVFNLDISFDLSSTGNVINRSFNLSGNNSYDICIFPENASYIVDSIMQFDAPNRRPRTYILKNTTLNNITQTINLYLVNSTEGELVEFTIIDNSNLPVTDVLLNIIRFYVGENTFRTMAISESDFDGNAVSYIILNDVFYKFVIIKNGVILADIDKTFITANEVTIQLEPIGVTGIYDVFENIGSSCSFDNTTETLTCNGVDTSGFTSTFCLAVRETLSLGQLDLCDFCETAAIVSMQCALGNISGRLIYFNFFLQGSETTLRAGYIAADPGADLFGAAGVFASAFVILFLAFITRTPSMVIIYTIAGFGMMVGLSIVNVYWSAVIGIATAGAIGVYLVRK